jgi:hypothetical protein
MSAPTFTPAPFFSLPREHHFSCSRSYCLPRPTATLSHLRRHQAPSSEHHCLSIKSTATGEHRSHCPLGAMRIPEPHRPFLFRSRRLEELHVASLSADAIASSVIVATITPPRLTFIHSRLPESPSNLTKPPTLHLAGLRRWNTADQTCLHHSTVDHPSR